MYAQADLVELWTKHWTPRKAPRTDTDDETQWLIDRTLPRPGRAVASPRGADSGLRTRLNIELNFHPKLRGARSRLYRRRFLQVNTRWKALAEIYTMHSFAPFFKLKISAKNRQHFFAIEYWISDFLFHSYWEILHFFMFFSANFLWNFIRISR